MIKYFVHAGFQFRTIDVAPSVLELSGADNIAVVVLDDVAAATLNNDQFYPILGTTQVLALNALTGYWTGTNAGIQKVRQDVLKARAPLISPNPSDADDTRGSPQTYTIHKESNQYILPLGFDHIVPTPNSSTVVNAVRVNLLGRFMFDWTNLQRFDTAGEAWAAYNSYFLTLGLMDEIEAAREIYFIEPSAEASS